MHTKVVAHNIKQVQVEHKREKVEHRQEFVKHKQVDLVLEQVGHKQGVKLEVVVRRPGLVVRRQEVILGVVAHKREELTKELVNKATELVELKVNITAVIEVADNIEELVVVVKFQAEHSHTICLGLQHLHYLLLDLTISAIHELETLICCGIEKEDYRTRLDCNFTY